MLDNIKGKVSFHGCPDERYNGREIYNILTETSTGINVTTVSPGNHCAIIGLQRAGRSVSVQDLTTSEQEEVIKILNNSGKVSGILGMTNANLNYGRARKISWNAKGKR